MSDTAVVDKAGDEEDQFPGKEGAEKTENQDASTKEEERPTLTKSSRKQEVVRKALSGWGVVVVIRRPFSPHFKYRPPNGSYTP